MMRLRAVVAFLLASVLCVTSCSSDPDKAFQYLRVTVDGQSALGITKKDVTIRGVVIFFHGLDKDEFALTADPPHTQLTNKLTDAGFAVISSKASGNAYGNPESQQNYIAVAEMALAQYHVQNVFFLAESMGTLAAINLLAQAQVFRVRGMAAINPALNLESAPPDYEYDVSHAYPGQNLAEVNPMNLPVDSMRGKSLRFYVTPTDQLVSTDKNALAFQEKFGDVADVSIVDCQGSHLDPSCIQPDDIIKWFSKLEFRNGP